MGFLSFGSAKGLSFQNDFEKDTDRLYQQEAYRTQVQAEKEKKTAYYAKLLEEKAAVAPSMTRELETYYKDLNNKIADFAIENPNFESDVAKLQEFNKLADGYINNDFIRKDVQSQENFTKLQEAVNKGDLERGSPEWEAEMDRYTKFQEEGGDAYTYAGYKAKDFNELLAEDMKVTGSVRSTEIVGNYQYTKVESPIGTEEKPLQSMQTAIRRLKDPKYAKVINNQFAEIEKSHPGVYRNPLDFYSKLISMSKEQQWTLDGLTPDAAYVEKLRLKKAEGQDDLADVYAHYALKVVAGYGLGHDIPADAAFDTLTSAGVAGEVFDADTKFYKKGDDGLEEITFNTRKVDGKKDVPKTRFELKRSISLQPVPDGGGKMKVSVVASVPTDDIKDFNEAGFTAGGERTESWMDEATGKSVNVTYKEYTGELYVDAIVNSSTLLNFEKQSSGSTTHVKDAIAKKLLDTNTIIYNATFEQNNPQFAAEVLSDTPEYSQNTLVVDEKTGIPNRIAQAQWHLSPSEKDRGRYEMTTITKNGNEFLKTRYYYDPKNPNDPLRSVSVPYIPTIPKK